MDLIEYSWIFNDVEERFMQWAWLESHLWEWQPDSTRLSRVPAFWVPTPRNQEMG